VPLPATEPVAPGAPGPKNMGNRALYDAMMEIRRSSATTPVPSGKTYKRKPKHGKWSNVQD
jgi:hypothetical protein